MKRLLSSFLAVLLFFPGSALEKETEALNFFDWFTWKTENQRLEEKCEKEKACGMPLNEQNCCIILGEKNLNKEIQEQLLKDKDLKNIFQVMEDKASQAALNLRTYVDDIDSNRLKGNIPFSEASNLAEKAGSDAVNNLLNSVEIKLEMVLCILRVNEIMKKNEGGMEIPTNQTSGEKYPYIEILKDKSQRKNFCVNEGLKITERVMEKILE